MYAYIGGGRNMSNKEKLLRAVAHVFCGITVQQFNEKFKGMSAEQIHRYMVIVCAERRQFGDQKIW